MTSGFVDHIEHAIEANGRAVKRGKIEMAHMNILLEEATSNLQQTHFLRADL